MKYIKKFNEASAYVEISKSLGWDKKFVSIPTIQEIEELGDKSSQGDYNSYYRLFAINRFGDPKDDNEIVRLNKSVEYFHKYENLFR